MDENVYFGKTSEQLKKAETKLKLVFDELKSVLQDYSDENIETSSRSLPLPKDFSYFGLEREHLIKRTLKVPEVSKTCLTETSLLLDSTLNSDHCLDSLPLLLHQHYTDRCESLRIMERLIMERWMERIDDDDLKSEESYKNTEDYLKRVRAELLDSRYRVLRLTPSRESFLTKDNHNLLTSVEPDDLLMYLMFMVERFKGTRKMQQFLKVVQWLPYSLEFEEMAEETMQNLARDNTDGTHDRDVSTEMDFKGNMSVPKKARFKSRKGQGPVNRKELKDRLKILLDEYGMSRDIDSISFVGEEAFLCREVLKVFKEMFVKHDKLSCTVTRPNFVSSKGQDTSDSSAKADSIGREELGQVKFMTNLRNVNKVDPLLDSMIKFFWCLDCEKVLRCLKSHVAELKKQPIHKFLNLETRSLTSNRSREKNKSNDLENIFLSIYTTPELTCGNQKRESSEAIGYHSVTSKVKIHDENDFDPIKLLGLEENEHSSSDPSTANGALFSFYLLRHLKIKDLTKQCYDIITYFNQLQLNLTSDSLKECKSSKHYSISRLKDEDIDLLEIPPSSKNRTPVISRTERANQFEKETKSDDDGGCAVVDGNILESVAKDFNSMEHDLLLVGSHYIEKSVLRESRNTNNNNNNNNANNNNSNNYTDEEMQREPMDLSWYGRFEVDRFEVLFDLWSCQRSFLMSLKKLIAFHLDCYQHTCDGNNRSSIRMLLLELLSIRLPDIYPGAGGDHNDGDYFCENFYLESKCIRMETSLMEKIRADVYGCDENTELRIFNPLSFLHIFHLSIHQSFKKFSKLERDSSSLKHLKSKVTFYTKVLDAWNDMELLGSSFSNQVQQDLFNGSIIDNHHLVCDLVNCYISSADNLQGKRSTREKHLNNLTCIANTIDVVTVRHRLLHAAWETEIFTKMYKKLSLVLRMEECNLYLRPIGFEHAKSKVKFGQSIGSSFPNYDENYAHILDRFVPNTLLLSIHELDETQIGKFSFLTRDTIEQLIKNISSLENLCLSLTTQVMTNKLFICSFEKALSIKNYKRLFSLTPKNKDVHHRIATNQSQKVQYHMTSEEIPNANENKSENKSLELKTPNVPKISSNREMERLQDENERSKKKNPMENGFLSIQLEKSIVRDSMLENFLKSVKTITELIKKPDDFDKVKRKYMLEYCQNLNRNIFVHECSINIINISISIFQLLNDIPILRKFFEPISDLTSVLLNSESSSPPSSDQTKSDTKDDDHHGDEMRMEQSFLNCYDITTNPWTLLTPATVHHLIKKLVISSSSLLNLETPPPAVLSTLNCGVKKSNEKDMKINIESKSPFVTSMKSSHVFSMIGDWLLRIQSVNAIICSLCSLATIGGSCERGGEQCKWGSPESIASELFELKKCLKHFQCNGKTTNDSVLEFLQLYSDVMSLKFQTLIDIKVGGAMRKKRRRKMMMDNLELFNRLKNQTLKQLGLSSSSSSPNNIDCLSFHLPDIMMDSNKVANRNHPWRNILLQTNHSSISHPLLWPEMKNSVHLCFAGFNDFEMKLANAELASLSLALQDVINTSANKNIIKTPPTNIHQPIEKVDAVILYSSIDTTLREQMANKISPVETYSQMKRFLLLTNQLEKIKRLWIEIRFNRNDMIGCSRTNHVERNVYKRDIIQPLLMQALKQITESSSSSSLLGRDDDDYDVKINIRDDDDDDDDDDIDEMAYNEIKRAMTLIEFMNKQASGLLADIELHMMDQSRKIMNEEKLLIMGRDYKRKVAEKMENPDSDEIIQTTSTALKIFMKKIEDDVSKNMERVTDSKEQLCSNISRLISDITLDPGRSDQYIDTMVTRDDAMLSPFRVDDDFIPDRNDDDYLSNIADSNRMNNDVLDHHHHHHQHHLQMKCPPNLSSVSSPFIGDLFQLDDYMIIKKSVYKDCCSNLASSLTADEDGSSKLHNKTVSSCFEKIQILEKENERMRDKLSKAEETKNVEAATKMADIFADGALEVGALRHKVAELEEEMKKRDDEAKERVRRDYDGAFKRVVASLLVSEKNYNQHRLEYCNDVFYKINESRKEAMEGLARLSLKMSLRMDVESSNRNHNQHHHQDSPPQIHSPPNMMDRLNEVMADNTRVASKCHLLRSFSFWRLYCAESRKRREITDLRRIIDKCLIDQARSADCHEKEKKLIKEELAAIKKAYSNLRLEFEAAKKNLDREMKDKSSKNHLMEEKIQSVRRVEEVCISKIKELNEEVGTKEELLASLTSDLQKTKDLKSVAEDRLKKDVEEAKRKLKMERNLKLDAFQEVNRLLGEIQKQNDPNAETSTCEKESKTSKANPLIRSSSSAKKWSRGIADQSARCKSAFVRNGGNKERSRLNKHTLDDKHLIKKNATQIQVTELIADEIFNRGPASHQAFIRTNSVNQFNNNNNSNNNNNNNKQSLKLLRPASQYYKSAYL